MPTGASCCRLATCFTFFGVPYCFAVPHSFISQQYCTLTCRSPDVQAVPCIPRCDQDNLRFVSWPPVSEGHYVLHPEPITGGNVGDAMQSGALFARKFDLEVCDVSASNPVKNARVVPWGVACWAEFLHCCILERMVRSYSSKGRDKMPRQYRPGWAADKRPCLYNK